MADLGICYVTDENFLRPTLLSVASLRRFVARDAAPVFVVVFGAETLDLRAIEQATGHLGVTFIDATQQGLPGLSHFDWSTTHVSPASVGRFLLDDLLPSSVRRILYIDGDTMIVGSLDPLLHYEIPKGILAAADDASTLYRSDKSTNGRETRAYFDGIALPAERSYFNAGVLLVERETWAGMAMEALRYLLAYPERCRYHDQSALNATVGAARVRLSPIWNFQTRFRTWGVPNAVQPRILHFTGASKPWLGPLAPWEDISREITADTEALDALSLPARKLTQGEIDDHNAQFTSFKERFRGLVDFRRRSRASTVVRLHHEAAL